MPKKSLIEAQKKHDAWLEKMGVSNSQLRKKLPHNKKGKRLGVCSAPNYKENIVVGNDSHCVGGIGAKKEENHYTGSLVIGIATLHKSNLVPIINKDQAVEAAQMRRN